MFAPLYSRLKNNAGIILIELMLASALGLLLISTLLKIYLVSQQSFRLQSSLYHIQDNAKIAINILSEEIHQAGYIGCAKLTPDFPLVYTRYSLTVKNKLTGNNTSLTIRHAALENIDLLNSMPNFFVLKVSDKIHFKKNNVLIISDCKHAEIFEVKNIVYSRGTQTIFPVTPLHYQFEQHAEVARFEVNHFFVSTTKRKDIYGRPISALYVKSLQGNTRRLVDGINAVNIEYIMKHHRMSAIRIDLDMASTPLYKMWHAYVSL